MWQWVGVTDTGNVKDYTENKHFDIEIMLDEFHAVETMKTNGPSNDNVFGCNMRNFLTNHLSISK